MLYVLTSSIKSLNEIKKDLPICYVYRVAAVKNILNSYINEPDPLVGRGYCYAHV